jgi:hypothetical protein
MKGNNYSYNIKANSAILKAQAPGTKGPARWASLYLRVHEAARHQYEAANWTLGLVSGPKSRGFAVPL